MEKNKDSNEEHLVDLLKQIRKELTDLKSNLEKELSDKRKEQQ